jgi:hypothetical protein
MIKRFLLVITTFSFGSILTTDAFSQSNRPKVSRTAKKYKKVRGFSSTTQPHADGLILESRSSGRKRVTKPVRQLEAENGGLDTADESPEFGAGNRKSAPKKAQNLLPYMEQSNLRKKRARKSGAKTIKRKSKR